MRRLWLILYCFISSLLPAALSAQSSTLLSLETASTRVQTGEFYEVNIRLDGAAQVWLADMEIRYDPAKIYVMGTKAGSPVRKGALFDPALSTLARNEVDGDALFFTISMLAPAEPVSGGGVIGTFRIYPLAPGATQMTFSRGELVKAIFETRDGQRVGVGSEPIPFTPVLLDLTISGDPVEPPSEATATPPPTETPTPPPTQDIPTEIPTLVNATAAPRTPEALVTQALPAVSADEGLPSLAVLAIGVMIFSVLGLLVLFLVARRRR